MRHTAARRAATALASACAVGLAGLAGVPSTAAPPSAWAGEPRPALLEETLLDQTLLEEALPGPQALTELGPDLDAAAAVNSMSRKALERLLADETAWVAPGGAVFFVDPANPTAAEPSPHVAPHQHGEGPTGAGPAGALLDPGPEPDPLLLHSNPGASRKIFLDFDGVRISSSYGSLWLSELGLAAGTYRGWSPAGATGPWPDALTSRRIVEVWQRVAEDFAPFDVDVTTQEPQGTWTGAHAVITDDPLPWATLCAMACGGIAYLDAWGTAQGPRVAWVFTGGTGPSPANVAEGVSHEVGHNLGLGHDGTTTQPYYRGHNGWGPIMGAAYNRDVTQFSRGQYPNANNTQDDLAVIAALTGHRPDEPGTVATAVQTKVAATSGQGVVRDEADVDVFQLGTCSGEVSVTVENASVGANLDVAVRVLDASGATIAEDRNPASMDAVFRTTVPVAGQPYLLRVTSDGTVDYPTYGSVGSYTWSVTGCSGQTLFTVPQPPQGLTGEVDPGTRRASIAWEAPPTAGASPVTGYRVSREGTNVDLPATVRTHTFGSLPVGTHEVQVRALNANGPGPAATTWLEVAPSTPTTTTLTSTYDATGAITLTADVIAGPGGTPPRGTVEFQLGASVVASATLTGGRGVAVVPYDPGTGGSVTAAYLPLDLRWSGSVSPGHVPATPPGPGPVPPGTETPTPVPRAASVLGLRVAERVRLGTRPRALLTLTADGRPVSGRLTLAVGRKKVTVAVTSGRVALRLPRLRASYLGRKQLVRRTLPITVTFAGDATTAPTSLRRVLRLKG